MSAAPEALLHPVQHGRAHPGRAQPPHLPRPEHRRGVPGREQLGQGWLLFVLWEIGFGVNLIYSKLCSNFFHCRVYKWWIWYPFDGSLISSLLHLRLIPEIEVKWCKKQELCKYLSTIESCRSLSFHQGFIYIVLHFREMFIPFPWYVIYTGIFRFRSKYHGPLCFRPPPWTDWCWLRNSTRKVLLCQDCWEMWRFMSWLLSLYLTAPN